MTKKHGEAMKLSMVRNWCILLIVGYGVTVSSVPSQRVLLWVQPHVPLRKMSIVILTVGPWLLSVFLVMMEPSIGRKWSVVLIVGVWVTESSVPAQQVLLLVQPQPPLRKVSTATLMVAYWPASTSIPSEKGFDCFPDGGSLGVHGVSCADETIDCLKLACIADRGVLCDEEVRATAPEWRFVLIWCCVTLKTIWPKQVRHLGQSNCPLKNLSIASLSWSISAAGDLCDDEAIDCSRVAPLAHHGALGDREGSTIPASAPHVVMPSHCESDVDCLFAAGDRCGDKAIDCFTKVPLAHCGMLCDGEGSGFLGGLGDTGNDEMVDCFKMEAADISCHGMVRQLRPIVLVLKRPTRLAIQTWLRLHAQLKASSH